MDPGFIRASLASIVLGLIGLGSAPPSVQAAGPIDFGTLPDVGDFVSVRYQSRTFNSRTGQMRISAVVTNTSSQYIRCPLPLIVTSFSTPGVTLANASGQTPDGDPFVDLSAQVGPDGLLAPGESTTPFRLIFDNPSRRRFRFQVSVLGQPVSAEIVTVSGTIYTDEAQATNVGAGVSVGLSINGLAKTTTDTTAGGVFSFSDVTLVASDTVTVFLDDDASHEATLVTQATDGPNDVTGLVMYTGKVVLTHESAGPMTNALLATADDSGEGDIHYMVMGNDVQVDDGFELWVTAGKAYRPGGAVVVDDLEVEGAGTFDSAAHAVTVRGSLKVSPTGNIITSGTVTFEGPDDQTVNVGNGQTLGPVVVDKTGGVLTFVNHGFTATSLAVSAGDTVKFQAGQTFTFDSLTLSGSSGSEVVFGSSDDFHGFQLDVSGTQAIHFATMRGVDAGGFAMIDATDNGTDEGFNVNVDFGAGPALQHATSSGNDRVLLRYDQPMDAATAADPSSYALSGSLTVSAASLDVTQKVVTLTASAAVTLGSTQVTATGVKSLTGRTLIPDPTVKTIVAGNGVGIPDNEIQVDVALSTDDNQRVIQRSTGFDFWHFAVTLTVTGTTDAITVGLGQINEAGGRGSIFVGATGTARSALAISSGGTPNTASFVVRGDARSASVDDLRLQAFVATSPSVERGMTLATVIDVGVTPACVYLADGRQMEQMASIDPVIPGVVLQSETFVMSKFGPHFKRSQTTLLKAPDFPPTDSQGRARRFIEPCGVEAYGGTLTHVRGQTGGQDNAGDFLECSRTRKPNGPESEPAGRTEDNNAPCQAGEIRDAGHDPVDLSNGEMKIFATDLAIPGRGLDYVFRRVYVSHQYRRRLAQQGALSISDFGENWTYSYADERLIRDGDNDDTATYIEVRAGQNGGAYVNTDTGVWSSPIERFTQLRKNPHTGQFEIREEDGDLRIYHGFSDIATPNKNGRLRQLRDRNGNFLTFLYDAIDPDDSVQGDEKFVLTQVIDTMGREIRYVYYANTAQSIGGRAVAIANTNSGAFGRLARVIDFKGDMDFTDSNASQDFVGQVNNRTLFFDYDGEGNLVRCSLPEIDGTPNGNDFNASGGSGPKTTRYGYIMAADLPNIVSGWGGLADDQKDEVRRRLLHKLTRVWNPNEVQSTPATDPADNLAAQRIDYVTDPNDPFFGFVTSFGIGGTNASGVPAGGIIGYTYTDLNLGRAMPGSILGDESRLNAIETLQVAVTDRNGNEAQYTFGGQRNLLRYQEKTSGFRAVEAPSYVMAMQHNRDRQLSKRTYPEGNVVEYFYNQQVKIVSDRFQHSNLIRVVSTPDARGGDQSKIENVFVYEPIYNRPCLVIFGRGSDIANNDFTPPIPDPAAAVRQMTDPYDSTKTVDLRYARVEFFDYQESAEAASSSSDATVSSSPLVGIDPAVLTTEVLLVREVGLPETSAGLSQLRDRLASNLTQLGLGDLNADGNTDPVIAGNIVRTVLGSPVLIVGSNQHALEQVIDLADLIDQAKGYMAGGTQEGSAGARLQTIVTMRQYNRVGQMTKSRSPEGNVSTYEYFPETDPDGDTVATPAPADDRTLGADTGGYLHKTTRDDTRNFAASNNNTNPPETFITATFKYDDVGNTTSMVNGRGIRTEFFVNELNQTLQTVRAADVSGAASADPPDPLIGDPLAPLTAFAYVENIFFDFNDNVVQRQVEDRGDTSSTGGFVDFTFKYDILDNPVETTEEVNTSLTLITRTRFDANENRVMTIYPEGNADSAVFDERDLLFQSTRGASARPARGLFGPGDPTSFNRPGGAGTVPSMTTYSYDKNQNLVETVDADDNGGSKSSIAGVGDVTTTDYDGYDRRKTVTDPLGNKTTYFYDPDDNVVRVIQDGDPIDDVVGGGENKTLAVTEYIHDSLSRVVATHRVLSQTPDQTPSRVPVLTDTPAMDSLAPYLADANSDAAGVPGGTGMTVIGRVTTLIEYDRESRVTFTVQDDLDAYRTDYDGVDRAIKTEDSALSTGFAGGSFNPNSLDGNEVCTEYDDNNNVIERLETDVTDVQGIPDKEFRTTYLYDSLDRLQTSFDNIGQAEDYRYDSRNNLVCKADAVGPVSGRSFNRRGCGSSQAVIINDFGNVTRTRYDGINRTLETEAILTASGQGDGTNIGCTLEGTSVPPPTPDGNQSEDGLISVYYAWDDNSQLLALRDDDGNTTGYIYDNQNRTLCEVKGLGHPVYTGTTFPTITCPSSGIAGDSGAFNVALRNGPPPPNDPPVDTEPDGTDINYVYDRDSNVVTLTDEAGNVFACTFDALNRKTNCTITRAAGFVGTTEQSFEFDGLSRMTFCFDNNEPTSDSDDVTCTYLYDSLSRKVEKTQKIGPLSPKAISCNYDIVASGAVGQCSATIYPDDRQVDNTYDNLDRLVSRTDQGQSSAIGTYAYIGKWRVATLNYQNGTRLTHLAGTADVGFDDLRRIVNHRWEKGNGQALGSGALIVGFEHQDGNATPNPKYNRANNKIIEFKTHDPDQSEQYKYDSVYRLTSVGRDAQLPNTRGFERGTFSDANRMSMSDFAFSQDWDLDALGNWQRFDNDSTPEARTHSDFNEIVTRDGATLSHDKNGNLTGDGTFAYEWDALNRLRRASLIGPGVPLVAFYTYDCHNRRLRKVVADGPGTTDFYYDGWRVVEEHDGNDQITQQYTWGNDLDEAWTIDDRAGGVSVADLNDATGSDRHFYHCNTLYHVYGLTDETGALKEGYQYDAYGKHTLVEPGVNGVFDTNGDGQPDWGFVDDVFTVGKASRLGNPWTHTGQRLDLETGLMYYKNRYMSVDLGRFVSRDPKKWIDGKWQFLLYGYVWDDPVNWVDPLGFQGNQGGGGGIRPYVNEPNALTLEEAFAEPPETPLKY